MEAARKEVEKSKKRHGPTQAYVQKVQYRAQKKELNQKLGRFFNDPFIEVSDLPGVPEEPVGRPNPTLEEHYTPAEPEISPERRSIFSGSQDGQS